MYAPVLKETRSFFQEFSRRLRFPTYKRSDFALLASLWADQQHGAGAGVSCTGNYAIVIFLTLTVYIWRVGKASDKRCGS